MLFLITGITVIFSPLSAPVISDYHRDHLKSNKRKWSTMYVVTLPDNRTETSVTLHTRKACTQGEKGGREPGVPYRERGEGEKGGREGGRERVERERVERERESRERERVERERVERESRERE